MLIYLLLCRLQTAISNINMLQRLKAGNNIPSNQVISCSLFHSDIELHPAAKAITTLKEVIKSGTFVFVAPTRSVTNQHHDLMNCFRLEKPNSEHSTLDQLEELRSKLVLGVAVEETEIERLIDFFQSLLLYPIYVSHSKTILISIDTFSPSLQHYFNCLLLDTTSIKCLNLESTPNYGTPSPVSIAWRI